MTRWRPRQMIRVLALGLHWRSDALLVAEVLDDHGTLKGFRPLGGGVEFGESWETALKREFQEELGLEVEIAGPPLVMENLFEHHGARGHEIVFAAEVRFHGEPFAGRDRIAFTEHDGTICHARWVRLTCLDGNHPPLFPAGLKARVAAAT